MTFGGNTRDLGSFGEERDKTTTLHQIFEEVVHTECGDGVRVFDSIDLNGATRNTARLHLFCFSLRDQAINWLDRLPAGSILTWDDLTTRFLAQFFPPGRTAKLRKDILMFQQHQDKSLYNTWTLQIFYDHVDYTIQMAIDYAAGGRLRKLRLEEAWETINDLAQHEEEEWNDLIFSEKGIPDYINANRS
ncbi:zinc finger, CCHC-type containing protein [Tanacetum coccineum]